jgi:hypothetical protein
MHVTRGMLLLVLGLVLALPAGAGAEAVAPPARVGGLVFLATRPRTVLPLAVAELRAEAEDRLDAVLAGSGATTVGARSLADRAGNWRVRTGQALPAGFLDELRSEAGVSEFYIVTVVVAADRLVVLARSLDTAGGHVRGVWLDEQILTPPLYGADIEAESAALRRAVDAGLGALARPCPLLPGVADSLLVLPAASIGCAPEEALAATHALLSHLRERENLLVVDPAVALGVLSAAGHDPAGLDAAGRELLRTRFGVDVVVRPALIAYDEAGQVAATTLVDDGNAAAGANSSIRSFSFNLTIVDLRDGIITGASDIHHHERSALGLFGHRRENSRLGPLRDAAGAAWTDLRNDRGDT